MIAKKIKYKLNLWLSEIITCEKAIYLSSKKQTSKLSLWESINLKIHLFSCEVCRKYISDIKKINNYLLKEYDNVAIKEIKLNESQKKQLQEKLSEQEEK